MLWHVSAATVSSAVNARPLNDGHMTAETLYAEKQGSYVICFMDSVGKYHLIETT